MNIFNELLRGKKPTIPQARETVERLTEQAEHAPVWLEQCQQELADALLAQVEGLADAGAIAKARKSLVEAQEAVSDSIAALDGARRRLAQVEGESNDKELAANKMRIRRLADERLKLALRFQKLAVETSVVISELQETAGEIYSMLPKEVCLTATLLNRGDLHSALQEQIRRAGASPWSAGPFCEYELERRPDLASRFEAANSVLTGV
jgi:chromosome segregation ATPase